jgi:peptidoglycan/xylan/chitin deacetylase (PgdA/CDA1 family)
LVDFEMIKLLLAVFVLIPFAALLLSPLLKQKLHAGGRVFVLHSTRPSFSEISSTSPRQLLCFLDLVSSFGLRFGSLQEALEDDSCVALTFDDGYDDLLNVWPLLRERGVPATIFLPTRFIGLANNWDNMISAGKRRHLSADQVKELVDEGAVFGSHSHNHRDLTTLSSQEVLEDLTTSRKLLEDLTLQHVEYLAYPFGKTNSRITALAREAGFRYAFGSEPGGRGAYYRGRIPLGRLDNSLTFGSKLNLDLLSGAEVLKSYVIGAFSHLTPASSRLKVSREAPIISD